MSYLYDLFFHYYFYYFPITITINHIILLKRKNLGHFYQKFSLMALLSFCLFFLPVSAWCYKNVAYNKTCMSLGLCCKSVAQNINC